MKPFCRVAIALSWCVLTTAGNADAFVKNGRPQRMEVAWLSISNGPAATSDGVAPSAASREASADEMGRYKLDGSGNCYWEPNDDGPDQCTPGGPGGAGRYKVNGQGECYWDANDSGPAQCSPAPRPIDPGEIIPNDGSVEPQHVLPDQIGDVLNRIFQPIPSCARFRVNGNLGWIEVQVNPATGHVQFGMGMNNPWENPGLWYVTESVNLIPIESVPKVRWYPIHGSRPPSQVPSGSIFGVNVRHLFMRVVWRWTFDPGHTEGRPWGGWRPILMQEPAISWGSLYCRMP